jgi:hypothetical protein
MFNAYGIIQLTSGPSATRQEAAGSKAVDMHDARSTPLIKCYNFFSSGDCKRDLPGVRNVTSIDTHVLKTHFFLIRLLLI